MRDENQIKDDEITGSNMTNNNFNNTQKSFDKSNANRIYITFI